MPNLLLMEGNPERVRKKAKDINVRSATEVYREAICTHFPDIQTTVLNAADKDACLPKGMAFDDFDGLVISGSSLRANDQEFGVTNQISALKKFSETGKPILGSCWGLQIAAIAAGGTVGESRQGREMGFARQIKLSEKGKKHPYFRNKAAVFDAPCIHYDEVTSLPPNADVLCSNSHSEIQGAVIPLGQSEIWAVQYHPEFDLEQLSMLFRLYKKDLMEQGFFETEAELNAYRQNIDRLAHNPEHKAAAWQLGVDENIIDPKCRRAEIINWVDHQILKPKLNL